MTAVHGQVTVTDSQGNDSVAMFEFAVDEPASEESHGGVHEVSGFQAEGFTVPAGEVWEVKGLVETPKNVVVDGTLRLRPGTTLRFVNVNESAFVGGGMDPMASDVGLWVMGDGVLDAQGTRKTAWNRTGSDPTWLPGDEVVLAPWAQGDDGANGFAPYGGGPVPTADPSVPPTEVLNLSRDVVIEGTPGGRSHIFIRSMRPQMIGHVLVRHMGPRKDGKKVTGRWPLHLHHMHDGSWGSLVEGVVVRQAGSHAFVPHLSHGITFRDCIAYDVQEHAYWWDPDTADTKRGEAPVNFTDHTTYQQCVAALVRPGDDPNGHRLAGFNLSGGLIENSNRCIGCVAVGVQGGANPAGFIWQEHEQAAPWVFEDNVSHNNRAHGIFTWQNLAPGRIHNIDRFVAYRNGGAGLSIGAYVGNWRIHDPLLVENGEAGILQHARSLSTDDPIRCERPRIIGSRVAFMEGDINFPDNPPVIICDATTERCGEVADESRHPTTTFDFVEGC
jgi:hypothetical protein